MVKRNSRYLRILIVTGLCLVSTNSFADLGLSSSDFGGNQVSGNRVRGLEGSPNTGKTNTSNSSSNTSQQSTLQTNYQAYKAQGTFVGQAGPEAPMCRLNSGSSAAEGSRVLCQLSELL